jgi:hypothetical protein
VIAWAVHGLSVSRPLYTELHESFAIPNPYSPVVPYLAWAFSTFFGTEPLAALEGGRLLTICSTLVNCAAIVKLARRSGVGSTAAAIAALAFAVAPILEPWGFEFRVDMTALAFDMVGLCLFCEGLTYWSVALFALSALTKQDQIAGIAAVALFSVFQGRLGLGVFLAICWVTLVAAAMLLFQFIWPDYLQNVVGGLASIIDFWAPIDFAKSVVFAHFAILILGMSALFDRTRERALIVCFLVTAAIQGAISSLHWGSNAYYFLSFIAAATLLAAASIEDLFAHVTDLSKLAQIWFGIALTFVLLCQREMPFIPNGGLRVLGLSSLLQGRIGCRISDTEPLDSRALHLLYDTPGTVLTNEPFILFEPKIRKVWFIELFILQGMLQHALFDDGRLLSQIRQHQFGAIALHGLGVVGYQAEPQPLGLKISYRGHAWFWPRLAQAITDNYLLVPGIGPPYIMLPKQGNPSVPVAFKQP